MPSVTFDDLDDLDTNPAALPVAPKAAPALVPCYACGGSGASASPATAPARPSPMPRSAKRRGGEEWPCAAEGLTSYRYRGSYGWVMIGARDTLDALREAGRSVTHGAIQLCRLEVWSGVSYQRVRTL